MTLLEYFMLIEGLIFPIFLIDNKSHIIRYAQKFTHYQYYCHAGNPNYFLDCGLIILSRFPLDSASFTQLDLPRDIGNRPGIIAVNIKINSNTLIRVYNLHLVPSLPQTKIPYKLVNLGNKLIGRDTKTLRKIHLTLLINDINRNKNKLKYIRSQSDIKYYHTILAGDFNIYVHSPEYELVIKEFETLSDIHNVNMFPLQSTSDEKDFPMERQIDFILADKTLINRYTRNNNQNQKKNQEIEYNPNYNPWRWCSEIENQYKEYEFHRKDIIHYTGELFCTRINHLFAADHYPLIADLTFLNDDDQKQ